VPNTQAIFTAVSDAVLSSVNTARSNIGVEARSSNGRNRRYPAVGSSDLKGWNPLISAVRTVQSPEVEGT